MSAFTAWTSRRCSCITLSATSNRFLGNTIVGRISRNKTGRKAIDSDGRRFRSHNNDPNEERRRVSNWKIQEQNPFGILGIPKNSTYQTVKRRFIELALKHHPDTSQRDENDYDEKDGAEVFIQLREAFESIRENSDGTARLANSGEDSSWTNDEFQAWFYDETGHQDIMFKMDLKTRKDVIDIANHQAQGGLDKGGMWEMARAMAEQAKSLSTHPRSGLSKAQSIGVEARASESPGSAESSSRRRRRR